ncbi:MAG: sporulation integral membrane protein YtvI [Clostridiales bacterium]|nr:sporulation integral membrane protein YtvI [Clostridiales bacterium]HBM80800.1 sporulation integral membrane protein YtvI [Clostridiaceae bacterium]
MINQEMLNKFNKIAIYTVSYSIVFILLYLLAPYILPFVIGTLIALAAQRPINFFSKKLKLNRKITAVFTVLIIFAIISFIIGAIIFGIVNQLISLSTLISDYFMKLKNQEYSFADAILSYYHSIDPSILNAIKDSTNKIFSGSFTAAVVIVKYLLNIIKSLPGILLFYLFTILSSIYIAIDLKKIKSKLFSPFSKEGSSRIKEIIMHTNSMIFKYLKAYMILISITFIETYIATTILGLKYSLLISIMTSIADLLPILGPGFILIPTGICYIIAGAYIKAGVTGLIIKGIGLLITYLIITVVRQILEPKVLSYSLGIHPLAIIIAIFVGIKAYGFIGMVFTIFYVVFYVILKKVEVL